MSVKVSSIIESIFCNALEVFFILSYEATIQDPENYMFDS